MNLKILFLTALCLGYLEFVNSEEKFLAPLSNRDDLERTELDLLEGFLVSLQEHETMPIDIDRGSFSPELLEKLGPEAKNLQRGPTGGIRLSTDTWHETSRLLLRLSGDDVMFQALILEITNGVQSYTPSGITVRELLEKEVKLSPDEILSMMWKTVRSQVARLNVLNTPIDTNDDTPIPLKRAYFREPTAELKEEIDAAIANDPSLQRALVNWELAYRLQKILTDIRNDEGVAEDNLKDCLAIWPRGYQGFYDYKEAISPTNPLLFKKQWPLNLAENREILGNSIFKGLLVEYFDANKTPSAGVESLAFGEFFLGDQRARFDRTSGKGGVSSKVRTIRDALSSLYTKIFSRRQTSPDVSAAKAINGAA